MYNVHSISCYQRPQKPKEKERKYLFVFFCFSIAYSKELVYEMARTRLRCRNSRTFFHGSFKIRRRCQCPVCASRGVKKVHFSFSALFSLDLKEVHFEKANCVLYFVFSRGAATMRWFLGSTGTNRAHVPQAKATVVKKEMR